jgi:hypothetical protein
MLGIAYAQRSLKGATRGSESGNLPRRYQAAWFRFDGTLPPQSGAAPLGLFAALTVFRTASQQFGSAFSPRLGSVPHFRLQPSAFSL